MKMESVQVKKELLAIMPDLRRFAFSVAGNSSDGDDLLQGTVERVLSRGVPAQVDMKKWVFRVCKNIWIDQYRASRVRQKASHEIGLKYGELVDGEKIAHARLLLEKTRGLIMSLPDDQRMAMTLVTIEGYSYKEASEILETPVGTIMSRLSRARKSLSDQMNAQKGES